jgi:hypothetical protein
MTYPYQYIFDRKRDIGQEVNSSNKRKSILDVQKGMYLQKLDNFRIFK